MTFISLNTSSLRSNMDPSKGCQNYKVQWVKDIHLWIPITRFLLATLANIGLFDDQLIELGKLLSQIYIPNQAIAYPPSLHINRATNIKMILDKTCQDQKFVIWVRRKGSSSTSTNKCLAKVKKQNLSAILVIGRPFSEVSSLHVTQITLMSRLMKSSIPFNLFLRSSRLNP